jgi:hypothetical protein
MNARKRKVPEDEEDEFPYGPSKYRTLEQDPLEEVVDMIANTKGCSFVWAKRIDYSELTEQIIVSHIFEQGLPLVCRLECLQNTNYSATPQNHGITIIERVLVNSGF